jgi:LacI family transcriptional regulator
MAGVTRDAVAQRAGVSVATVSYVLNGGPRGVSDEKRQRVLRAVAELHYRPNAIARSLRAGRTQILGLVLPDSANPYYAALAHAVEEAAAAHGYQVVVANAAEDPGREARHIEALLRLRVDGLLWIPAEGRGEQTIAREMPTAPAVPTVRLRALPTVRLDDAQEDGEGTARPALDVIEADNERGGWLAAQHALDLGHRRIACVAGPTHHLHASARLRGMRAALAAAGVPLPARSVARGSMDYASGARHAVRWGAQPAEERPTALLCANDAMALGALCALAEAGVRVPRDLSVIGFDDIPPAAYAVPPLTTIAQPVGAMGEAAVERLLARIEGAKEPAAVRVLPVTLVVRRSTAPPP